MKNILNILGALFIIALISYLVKEFSKLSETKIISDEAVNAIRDKEKAKELRIEIEKYHKTGKWEEKNLEKIFI